MIEPVLPPIESATPTVANALKPEGQELYTVTSPTYEVQTYMSLPPFTAELPENEVPNKYEREEIELPSEKIAPPFRAAVFCVNVQEMM